jgi:hypothetical protein
MNLSNAIERLWDMLREQHKVLFTEDLPPERTLAQETSCRPCTSDSKKCSNAPGVNCPNTDTSEGSEAPGRHGFKAFLRSFPWLKFNQ